METSPGNTTSNDRSAINRKRMRTRLSRLTVFGLLSFRAAEGHIMAPDGHAGGTALGNGIEVKSGHGLLRIIALRDDILRVTISATDTLPRGCVLGHAAQGTCGPCAGASCER